LEDEEYPSWLWTLLDDKNAATGEMKVDLACKFIRAPGLACSLP